MTRLGGIWWFSRQVKATLSLWHAPYLIDRNWLGRTQASQNAAPRNRQKQQEPTFLKRFFGLIVGSHSSASDRAGRRNSY